MRDDGTLDAPDLSDLWAHVDLPPTPDLAAAVTDRLRRRAVERRRRINPFGRPIHRAVLLAAAALLVLAGVAVAVRLGVGGLSLVLVEQTPRVTPVEIGGRLHLGERVGLTEARRRVEFAIALPALPGLGEPDAVFVSQEPPGGRVSLVYGDRPGFPADETTDIGLIVTQFRRDISPETFEKLVHEGVRLTPVTVNAGAGYWLEGGEHLLIYRDASGREVPELTRLVGDALIWEQHGLTLRLEGAPSLEDALRVAESIP